MPIYEYRCTACNAVQEILQKVQDPAPETCPACGKIHSMEKLISHTSFQLKGGGWYKDLYASTPASSASSSPTSAATPPKTESSPPPTKAPGDCK